MPRMRLGVALLVPDPVRTEIEAMRRALGDGSLDRVPAHVTLVPPVNVHERDLDAAFSMLRDAASACAPLTLDLGPPTTFLPDNPVLYLAVAGDIDALEALRHAVFRPPLHREQAWPYVPHVTLSEQDHPERIASAAVVLADYRASITVDRVHMLREVDQRWVRFADAGLGGRRVVARGGLELEISESSEPEPPVRTWLDDQWSRHGEALGRSWDERGLTLTARRGGVVVGAATGWTNEGVGHLSELVVGADVRGEGGGSHLLAAFEDASRRRGARWLTLRTDAGSPAQGFYERRGWVLTGTLDDWVDGRTISEMRKDL